jgi:hypothetical protein
MAKDDQVWAEESGITVRATRKSPVGPVVIRVYANSGLPTQEVIATATLGAWRWDSLVASMAKPERSEATKDEGE